MKQNSNIQPRNFDARDIRIKELEAEVKELKEQEKILKAIREAQEDILHESRVLLVNYMLSRAMSPFLKILVFLRKFYSRYISQTFVGLFYRKLKNIFK